VGNDVLPHGGSYPCGLLSLDILSTLGQLANQQGEWEDVEDSELRRITSGQQEGIIAWADFERPGSGRSLSQSNREG